MKLVRRPSSKEASPMPKHPTLETIVTIIVVRHWEWSWEAGPAQRWQSNAQVSKSRIITCNEEWSWAEGPASRCPPQCSDLQVQKQLQCVTQNEAGMKAQEQEQGFSCLTFSKYWANTPPAVWQIWDSSLRNFDKFCRSRNREHPTYRSRSRYSANTPCAFWRNGGVLGRF